jgi:putative tryptophan/tyrosine transport system substrate-binding protein
MRSVKKEDRMRFGTPEFDQKRRSRIALFATALLLASLGSALTMERLPKVGYLGFGAFQQPTHFQNRLSELGYTEGKEVVVEFRFADGKAGELPRLARELVDPKVDVIMAAGDEAIVAAKNVTRTIPIVIIACDAVTTGFVASLARPGGNLTGVSCLTSELMPKRMALLTHESCSEVSCASQPANRGIGGPGRSSACNR